MYAFFLEEITGRYKNSENNKVIRSKNTFSRSKNLNRSMKGKMRTLPKNLEPKEKEKADKKIYFKTSGPVKGKTFNY